MVVYYSLTNSDNGLDDYLMPERFIGKGNADTV